MFCSGSGGRDWYFRGICAVRAAAKPLIREFIKVGSRQNASVLRELMTVLQNHEGDPPRLSTRDAAKLHSRHRLLRWQTLTGYRLVARPTCRAAQGTHSIRRLGGRPFAAAPPSPSCTPSPRVCAVLGIVGKQPTPVQPRLRSAQYRYRWRTMNGFSGFPVDMRAGMRGPEIQFWGTLAVWPDEFHLSSGSLITPSSATIASAASAVGRLPNALGLLILRDITRIVRVIVDPLLIVPWRNSLEIDAAVLTLAIKIFEAEKGANLRSVAELLDAGIIQNPPVDRITGAAANTFVRERLIRGPSNARDQAPLFLFPADAAPVSLGRIPKDG